MKQTVYAVAAFAVAFALAGVTADAKTSKKSTVAQASPAPASGTILDKEYDGKLHYNLTPYIWLPSINGNLQFTTPVAGRKGRFGGVVIPLSVQVGPNQYLSKINFAAMGAFEIRKGVFDLSGDYINLNGSMGTTNVTQIQGPKGGFVVPINLGTSSHLASSIWDLNAGISVAHGSDADLVAFGGYSTFPITATLSYNVSAGRLKRSGGLTRADSAQDWIWGLRGQALFGNDKKWFVPYYFDSGMGNNNNTYQYYTGVGRVFGQNSVTLTWRSNQYTAANNAAPNALVQRLRFDGPMLGYTFGL